jgi:pimeloyl-ACP methyl ester carboxylesterase
MLRQGEGEPLVLLHGILCDECVWSGVTGLLAGGYDVIVPTMLGHHGGAPVRKRPASVEHVVDDVERLLDELGLAKAHLAGNSLGGWVALELARRGRALTVCALSPAGAWESDGARRAAVLRRTVRDTRRSRAILPLLARSGRLRHWALRHSAVHGERVSPAELLAMADDVIGCEIAEDLFADESSLAPLDPPSCPITLAWAGRDRIFPVEINGARARELIPAARFLVLDGVGHVPMLDDPQLVARTILASTTAGSHDDG